MFWLPFVAVLLSRLPFIGLGFGLEPDGWRVAANARRIAATGVYSASRLGANPVHEIGTALLFGGDVWGVTAAAAVATAIAAGALAQTIWRIRGSQSVLLGVALGFVPVVYVASTGGKDYPWTLAFLTLSVWTALENRAWWSGLTFGLAVGCRLSIAPMGLVPLILVLGHGPPGQVGRALRLVVGTTIAGGLAYAPVLYRYGLGFIGYTWTPPLTLQRALHKGGLEVWGPLGLLGLLAVAGAGLLWRRSTPIFATSPAVPSADWRWAAWMVGALMPAALFFRFPSHAGYWVPAVPFVLLLAAERLSDRFVAFLAACLLLSPFVVGVRPATGGEDVPAAWGARVGPARIEPLRGPILLDRARRKARLRAARRTISALESLEPGSTVIVGYWGPMLNVLAPRRTLAPLRLMYAPPRGRHTETSSASPYYFLPGALQGAAAAGEPQPEDRLRPLPLPPQ